MKREIPLYGEVVTLEPYAFVSVGDYNHPDWRWNNVEAGVALSVALSENITPTGYGAYSHALDAIHAEPARFPGTGRNEFWGGAKVAFAF